jgi:octaheme c-type cytochrome (tetrathionate reductase family)
VKRLFLLSSTMIVLGLAVVLASLASRTAQAQDQPADSADGPRRAVSDAVAADMDPAELIVTVPNLPTADHSQFEILKQDFQSGPEVTAACLTCHTEAAHQLMQTSHWTWICPRAKQELEDEQHIAVGKAEHVINNFCIALPSNEPRCTSCHAGYGWEDKTFDFGDETRVDCLICHDQTGTYKKFPTSAGHPVYESTPMEKREWPKGSGKHWEPVDLAAVARSVGTPTRSNCGSCHFYGGGGEGVKHGDMDVTLAEPHRSLDVHMAVDGANFNCQTCHTTASHKIAGRCFSTPAFDEREFVMRGTGGNMLACESCHTPRPHPTANPHKKNGETIHLSWSDIARNKKLNDHTDKVACETCHVPKMAPEKATKMWWDWSKAGEKTEDGKPVTRKTELQTASGTETVPTYLTKKGEFIWAANVNPEYIWFNGRMNHTFMGDKIDDQTPAKDLCEHSHGANDLIDENEPVVFINRLDTGYADPLARIKPVKIHRGIQPYDPVNKTLVIPKLFPGKGPDKGEAYWKIYDWGRSIEAGMAYAGLEYSGEFDWIQTEMIWPLSHMVKPADEAVTCGECHTRSEEGRLAEVHGFYMPGRDHSPLLDWLGILLIVGALGVSLLHGSARLVFGMKG